MAEPHGLPTLQVSSLTYDKFLLHEHRSREDREVSEVASGCVGGQMQRQYLPARGSCYLIYLVHVKSINLIKHALAYFPCQINHSFLQWFNCSSFGGVLLPSPASGRRAAPSCDRPMPEAPGHETETNESRNIQEAATDILQNVNELVIGRSVEISNFDHS